MAPSHQPDHCPVIPSFGPDPSTCGSIVEVLPVSKCPLQMDTLSALMLLSADKRCAARKSLPWSAALKPRSFVQSIHPSCFTTYRPTLTHLIISCLTHPSL